MEGLTWLTTLNRRVTTIEIFGTQGRLTLGCSCQARRRMHHLQERHPFIATDIQDKAYPQGHLRGGEDDQPTGPNQRKSTGLNYQHKRQMQVKHVGAERSLRVSMVSIFIAARMGFGFQYLIPHTSPLGEMQEEQDPDTHHSVRSLLDSELEEDSQSEPMNQSMQE